MDLWFKTGESINLPPKKKGDVDAPRYMGGFYGNLISWSHANLYTCTVRCTLQNPAKKNGRIVTILPNGVNYLNVPFDSEKVHF